MAQEKEIKKVEKTDRQIRWEKFVANYKIVSPVKGKAKEARGEFAVIPDSFK
jgi:hypothetical protein